MRKAVMAAIWAGTFTGAIHAEEISPQVTSNALIEVIAERGLECGQLKRWQSLSLRALALDNRRRWSDKKRAHLKPAISNQLTQMECESEVLNAWIDGAREGFDYEILPPYLIVYEAMSTREAPPHVFSAVSLRADRSPVIDAVNAKLLELASSERKAEGGKPWPDYIEATRNHALGFAVQLEPGEADEAAAWIAQSAMIVEAWYEEEIQQ